MTPARTLLFYGAMIIGQDDYGRLATSSRRVERFLNALCIALTTRTTIRSGRLVHHLQRTEKPSSILCTSKLTTKADIQVNRGAVPHLALSHTEGCTAGALSLSWQGLLRWNFVIGQNEEEGASLYLSNAFTTDSLRLFSCRCC